MRRLRGIVDLAMAALFAWLARSTAAGPVRGIMGAAGAYHAGAALLKGDRTPPQDGSRTRTLLDATGGLALCAAGVVLRREPAGARLLLLGAGMSELLLATSLGRRARQTSGSTAGVAYPPLDEPKPVARDVWIVDSVLPGAVGRMVGVRMTVIRLRNGDLLLHSPTRHTVRLQRALAQLGTVRHLVAPNLAHLSFLPGWQAACPGATTWAAPGVRLRGVARRGVLRVDKELGEAAPAAWGGDVSLVMVPGAAGFHEAVLFHEQSSTLVLTDLVLNLERQKVPWLLRPLVSWAGSLAPEGMPPPHLRGIMKLRGPEMVQALQRVLALRPERVIFAHGHWFERDGVGRLRRSLRWALPEDGSAPAEEQPDTAGALLTLGNLLLDRLLRA